MLQPGGLTPNSGLNRRQKEEERKKGERPESTGGAEEQDVKMEDTGDKQQPKEPAPSEPVANAIKEEPEPAQQNGGRMEVDDENAPTPSKEEAKQETPKSEIKESASAALLQAAAGDEDDAVEY